MTLIKALIICILTFPILIKAQNNNGQGNGHSTIKSFALKYEDGNPAQVSTTMDSSVYINYVVELKDTNAVNKVYVRISNGQNTDGSVYQVNYTITPSIVTNNLGRVLFKREKEILYILTVSSTQLADLNFEVATENYSGQISSYLNWEK